MAHRLTVERKWSQALGFPKLVRTPKIGKIWHKSGFHLSNPDYSGHWWFPYPISFNGQKCMKVEVREAEVLFAELAEEALDFLVPDKPDSSPVDNPKGAIALYNSMLHWKLSLPDRLRFEETVLPSTILLQ
jgi:hypothetical protein